MNETPVPRKLALSLLAVAFASCESAPSSPVVAVDSAGVRVVVSDPSASDAMCAVGEEPLLVVGNREDDPAHLFGDVAGAARLSDGSVAVVDPTVDQVRIFDETGEHLRSLGRMGDGPGEFRNAWYVWVRPGDTLWVGDYRPWRYNVFAADGAWSRAVELDPIYPNPSRGGGVLSNGTLVTAWLTRGSSRSFDTPDTLVVEAHDPDGKLVGVLAGLPNRRLGQIRDSTWPDLFIGPVFDSRASVSARGDHIAMGTGREAEVRVLDSEYRLTTIVRWNAGDRSVSGADLDAYREDYRAQNAWRSEPSRTAGPTLSPRRPAADQFPAFSGLLMGNAGHLFVFPYRRPGRPEPESGAMVFSPTGEFMCRLPPMPDHSLAEAGPDYLLTVHTDELDVSTVVVHSFAPSTAAVTTQP